MPSMRLFTLQDVWAGALLAAFGIAALIFGADLPMGTARFGELVVGHEARPFEPRLGGVDVALGGAQLAQQHLALPRPPAPVEDRGELEDGCR